jgi:death on curing protein
VKLEWIGKELVFAIHAAQIAEHGGKDGLRDLNALESALARPHNLVAYSSVPPSVFELAGAYASGIARNHPFIDGKKRVAVVVSITFLELNGVETRADEEQLAVMFELLAAGKLKESELVTWLKTIVVSSKKRPRKAR